MIWFAVRDGVYDLTEKERAEVLVLLQDGVTTAYECQNIVFNADDEQKSSCGDKKRKEERGQANYC